jgi:hypothetical protein
MKNDHLLHAEDLLITEANPFVPLNILEQVYNFLTGIPTNTTVSVKWDGCPAFVVGKNPENNRFFVGTKSVFSGKKVNYCHADIMENYPDNKKLQAVLMELYDKFWYIDFPHVLQGDLLWMKDEQLGDEDECKFQPNTLVYVIPNTSKIYNNVLHSDIGCVFHTTYTGTTLENMEAHVGAINPDYLKSEQIYAFDPKVYSPKNLNFNLGIIPKMREQALKLLQLVPALKYLQTRVYFQQYINYCIKKNNITYSSFDFIEYQNSLFEQHISKLKTQRGKENAAWDYDVYLNGFDRVVGPKDFEYIIAYYLDLVRLKNTLINVLDTISVKDIAIYLPDGRGCGHEGYVATSLGYTVKLVDRFIFSRANFERWSE